MELLKLAHFCNYFKSAREEASGLLKEVDVKYTISDKHPKWPGCISLHFAAKKRACDLTNELLEQGADLLKQSTGDRCTPLHTVINKTLDRKFLYFLFEKEDSIKEYKKNQDKECREFKLMNALLSKQVEISNTSNPKNKYGLTHLHIACMINHTEAVEFFAKAGETLDTPISYDPDDDPDDQMHMEQFQGCTPLHCAIKCSSIQVADILLQYGADIHAKSKNGMSCLYLLIERMMDMTDFMRMGKRSFCMTCIKEVERLESIIVSILKTRANDEIFVDEEGLSALHLACILKDKSIVENLLKHNVDVNMSVKSESKFWPGWTPLHFAACFNIEIIKLLMEKGADITLTNSKRETPLDLCAKRFTPSDLQVILSTKNELEDIVLSDNRTKLSKLLLILDDYDKFGEFLQNLKNVNLTIPPNSPIWPGYNLLHLCLSLNEKTIHWKVFRDKLELAEIAEEHAFKRYNCTEEEEALYLKRIELCLQYGCDVNMKNVKGQTPIHLAFTALREATVIEKLLGISEDNVVDQNDLSHLHIACALGQLDVVKRYMSRGANVNSRVKASFDWYRMWGCSKDTPVWINLRENSTPLHVAVMCDHENIAEYLLQNNADVYVKDSLDLTPIHLAFFSESAASLLIKSTSNLRESVSKVGMSHLHVAVKANDHKAVERLLLEGAQVDRIIERNIEQVFSYSYRAGKTPLSMECETSDKVIEALLKGGANPHAKDFKGLSVLQYSIHDLESVWTSPFVRLMKKGMIDVEPSGLSLLQFACGKYDIDWVKKLLKEGADVNARINAEGKLEGATALHVVFDYSIVLDVDPDFVYDLTTLLLKSGADVTIQSCSGLSPLHLIYEEVYDYRFLLESSFDLDAELQRRLPVVDLLLDNQKSYDVNPSDRQGFSHFHFSCIRNKVETVKKFLDHGIDVNHSIDPFVPNIGGFTPLHFAMAHGSKEVAYLLLERGADVNAEDAHGNKPLHAAIKMNFIDLPLIETILRHGADINDENLNEESPLYCLLKSRNLTLEGLEFFLNRGCFKNILNATDENNQDIIGLAMLNSASTDRQMILERLTQVLETKNSIDSGFNVIASIVAIEHEGELTVEIYLRAIEYLMSIGCELDQQDIEGETALHVAVSFYNLEAVNALLLLGADINVVDNMNISPFSGEVIGTANDPNEPREIDVVKSLARHVWKLRFIGLAVNDSNLRCLNEVERKMDFLCSLKQSCQDELTKAKDTEIDQSLTAKDFLSEQGAVIRYPRMYIDRRTLVDQFFENTVCLRREFPELCDIMALQYRKACARMELTEPTKEIIATLCERKLPDYLLDDILRFFTNNDMKHVIEIGKQLFQLP